MKTLLTFILAFTSHFCFAQFIISPKAGIVFSSVTKGDNLEKSSSSPLFAIKAGYKVKTYSFGVDASMYSAKLGIKHSAFNPNTGQVVPITYRNKYFNPGLNLSAFASKHIIIGKPSLYFGVNAGYIFSLSTSAKYDDAPAGLIFGEPTPPKGSSSGFTAGIHAGVDLPLSNHFSLTGELAPRYLFASKIYGETKTEGYYNTIVIPVSVGITFSL